MKLSRDNQKLLNDLISSQLAGLTGGEKARKEKELEALFTEIAKGSLKSFGGNRTAESIIEMISKETLDPREMRKKIAEVRKKQFIAEEKTGLGASIFLQSVFGESFGKRLSARFAKVDPSKVQQAMEFMSRLEKQAKQQKRKKPAGQDELYTEIGIGEGVVQTGGTAQVKKRRNDRLSRMIYADETWEVKATELLESLLKSTGKYQSRHPANEFGNIHEKLRWIIENCCKKGCGALPIPLPGRPPVPVPQLPIPVPGGRIPQRVPIPIPAPQRRVPLPAPERVPLPDRNRLPTPERIPIPLPGRVPVPGRLPSPAPSKDPVYLPNPARDTQRIPNDRIPDRFKRDKIGRLPPIDVIPKPIAKEAGEAAAKSVAKKVPGLGILAGLGFAAERVSKGQYLKAAGEAASGVLGSIPGLGTLASTAIDVGLAASDISDASKATGKVTPSPVTTQDASTLASIKSDTSAIIQTMGGKPASTGAPTSNSTGSSTRRVTPAKPAPASPPVQGATATPQGGFFRQAYSSLSSEASSAWNSIKTGMGFAAPPSSADLKSYVKLKDGSVNIDGLNLAMQERLAGLAKEYYDRTGKKLQINSGFRDSLEQAKLFAKYGSPRAAPPGTSMHEHGLAVDINTSDANEAARLGLMAKYGFSRPVPGETWHLQPIEARATPDNPYSPGTPIAVAGDGGKAVSPTGAASIDLTAQSAVEKVYADAAAAAPAAVSSTSTSSVAMQDVNPKSAADPRDLGLMSAGADTSMMQDINAAEAESTSSRFGNFLKNAALSAVEAKYGLSVGGLQARSIAEGGSGSAADIAAALVSDKIQSKTGIGGLTPLIGGLFSSFGKKKATIDDLQEVQLAARRTGAAAVQNQLGTAAVQASNELQTNQNISQAMTSAPVVINNTSAGGKSAPPAPAISTPPANPYGNDPSIMAWNNRNSALLPWSPA